MLDGTVPGRRSEMHRHNLTDRKISIESDEYVWDIDENTEVHKFVMSPIARLLGAHGARAVLDLGCGNGSLTGSLSRQGFDMVGLDVSASGVERARRQNPGIL